MLHWYLNNDRCSFVTSDFPTENPRTQNRTILIHKRCR